MDVSKNVPKEKHDFNTVEFFTNNNTWSLIIHEAYAFLLFPINTYSDGRVFRESGISLNAYSGTMLCAFINVLKLRVHQSRRYLQFVRG